MKPDKSILLLVAQLLMMTGLIAMDLMNQPQGIFRGVLCTALFAITGILLFMRFQFMTKLRGMIAALKRAIGGNVNTRLLANDEPLYNEVIFSVNELIEQLDKVRVQTLKSEAARKSLLSNISHDIRTPLTSIIGYVDALSDDIAASSEEKQQYVAIISTKATALKNLIDEIFHLAKLDADEVPLQPETLDLAELAREAVIDFLPELKKADMELNVSIPEEKCLVTADRLSLRRIMNNMIKNAVQYGQHGKILGVELSEHATEYQLSIWDKGPGIPKDELTKVFERMYRTERSRNPLHGGSGLGLAIAKALVEKNGGEIWAESEPGRKTSFSFSVPRHF
ncbi:sensor histidine kinase [Paenibacillus apiarius]|uniref:histidine kinase n=1 Tax=Paenibacillus apiarius TaxID=46240 RepID=A0ABT4DWQ9_9BACL|nr:HAMP domain-containing sensor histidine kinase [Paenibacillus apiarius]MCY9513478.1 HAMP domain-containing histidine kinase [Paenibacillus apiarius]MCY9521205.1 HAMP domain-containing histidine kinase [Paenibacillus apiarius]MCY9553394.1 HAMP domain-containing histidine kinase [Paenibacillus apiarius]MCY9559572.1 HAMP domain-containing histidine kinase [Paenibacillus apiarius]MCY9685423.1 HAMP domain-containing histidine kinase [Paenibacillus apiarius]